jgi:hypothetical protein
MTRYEIMKQKYHNAFEAVEMLTMQYGAEILFEYAYKNFTSALNDLLNGDLTDEEKASLDDFGALIVIAMDDFAIKYGIAKMED